MLRFFKPFLFFLLISANYNAQIESCSLTGSLIDSSLNTPISGAYVYWFKGNKIIQYTITDDIGLFELKNIKSGIQNIRVRHLGYEELNMDVRISSGENKLEFRLRQSHISLSLIHI